MVSDKERLALLEQKVGTIEAERKEWKTLICDAIKHVIYGAMGLISAGILSGWHLPEPVRKYLLDLVSK